MFREYLLNVTGLLRGGTNQLQIHFTSPISYAKKASQDFYARFVSD